MEGEMKGKGSEKMVSEETQTEAWHKPKNGSVFPAKRRSVKQMMWDRMVESTANKTVQRTTSKSNNSVYPCSSS
ncbi:hypothetical protein SESBI_40015 [Sesbania bispinosa]|nr:hypothetical protein SESBI_40015 [Sesbania bispinosa]